MKINKMTMLNMDMFYSSIVEILESEKLRNIPFGRNFSQMLNNISITFEISEVSRYEFLFLKMYTTSATIINNISDVSDDYLKKQFSEIYDSSLKAFFFYLQNLNKKYNEVNEKDGNNYYHRYFSPVGCIIGDVSVTLSGSQIANIITLEPITFFLSATDYKCKKTTDDSNKIEFKKDYDIYNDDTFKNYIIATFMTKFYKFITDKVTYVDFPSDTINHNKFFITIDKNISILNIHNPLLVVDLLHDDMSFTLDKLKTYKNRNYSKEFTCKNTWMDFCISCSFSAFIEIASVLPYDKIISMESLQIPTHNSLDETSIPKAPDTFEHTHKGRYNTLIKDIKEKYQKDKYIIKKLELTAGYVQYNFIIRISLDDVDRYIGNYFNMNKYNDYIFEEVSSIFKDITKYALIFYKSMQNE